MTCVIGHCPVFFLQRTPMWVLRTSCPWERSFKTTWRALWTNQRRQWKNATGWHKSCWICYSKCCELSIYRAIFFFRIFAADSLNTEGFLDRHDAILDYRLVGYLHDVFTHISIVQDCNISIAYALELLQFCIKPLILHGCFTDWGNYMITTVPVL